MDHESDHQHDHEREGDHDHETAHLPGESTDADRTATGVAGEMDEAGEDEQVEGNLLDRAIDTPPAGS